MTNETVGGSALFRKHQPESSLAKSDPHVCECMRFSRISDKQLLMLIRREEDTKQFQRSLEFNNPLSGK